MNRASTPLASPELIVRTAPRVLLVEDDDVIAEFVARGLAEDGFVVKRASNGHEAALEIDEANCDLIILDWWLPGPDGLALLQQLRAVDKCTPVLFLTARDAVQQRVTALRAGADDYLCKPFALDELTARAAALVRRARGIPTQWRYEDVLLDLALNIAQRAARPLQLTAREQALLLFFLRHPEQILSRNLLYEQVWNEPCVEFSNTLEMHVMSLRKKLEEFGPRIIHTVRGQGYRLGSPTASNP